ncbi:MAG: hypothetical protein HC799_13385 [Limnothrix sp. RL_2_0]|nr:hypothetical protein [Limnothrix sp. RL_2_0]
MTPKKFKNYTLLLLTLATFQLSLMACGDKEPATNTDNTSTETTATSTNAGQSTAEDPSTSATAETNNWVDFTTENKAISIKFPGPPETQEQTAPTNTGEVQFSMTTYADESSKQFFMVSSVDYPVNPDEYDVEQGLEGAKNGAAQNSGSTIVSDEASDRFGIPGKKLVMNKTEQGETLTIRAELYIDPKGPTLHQIMIVVQGDDVNTPEANAFFDSAQITKL